jgi:transposase InsO family protein
MTVGYFWPSLFKDYNEFCKSCPTCQAYGRRAFSRTEFYPIYPTGAFEKWGIDFVGPLPRTQRKNEYLIVATDYLTKWAEAAAVPKADKVVAAEFIFNQVVCKYGCPLEVVTDQGGHFMNDVLRELLQHMSIKHHRASPYYPQANGLVEKTNGILIGIIAKVVEG